MMTYDEALCYIHSLRRFGKKAGLTKITRLLGLLGDPQKQLKFVHIAGTNGKGSTAVMTAKVLEQSGYKAGLFISPYVLDFTERMQVNSVHITGEQLAEITEQVKTKVDIISQDDEAPSEFEVVTAIAMCFYKSMGCDIVVLEVGLGGRLDPTNVIDPPLVAAITNIGLDHTDILGDTIEKIAFEKCGIIKQNCTVVCYPAQPPNALGVIMQQAALNNAVLIQPTQNMVRLLREEAFCSLVQWGETKITLPLAGEHQVQNLITALGILEALRQKGFNIPDDAVAKGIEAVRFPARMELISRKPDIVLDGAHNPQGAQVAARVIARTQGRRVLILGCLGDKDYTHVAEKLAPLCDEIFTVDIEGGRGLSAKKMCEAVKSYNPNCSPCSTLEEALAAASASAGECGTVFICGSLYLAAQIRPLVLRRDEKP